VSYLNRVFEATEEENRRAFLGLLPAGGGGNLLDLGTHEGEFTERVAARIGSTRTVGIEFIEAHAAVARARGIEIVEADLDEGLPFDDGQFQTVTANQVLEHVRHTDSLLREVRRVLAPAGIACISTNNMASWHNALSLALGFQPPPMHVSDEVIVGNPLNPQHRRPHEDVGRTHLRLFTGRALRELCAHHGLRTRVLKTAGYYPLPVRLARIATRIDPVHGAFLLGVFVRDERIGKDCHHADRPCRP